jgi:hypothetical protein
MQVTLEIDTSPAKKVSTTSTGETTPISTPASESVNND